MWDRKLVNFMWDSVSRNPTNIAAFGFAIERA
jgi:hypothetical protein